jgi:peptidase E
MKERLILYCNLAVVTQEWQTYQKDAEAVTKATGTSIDSLSEENQFAAHLKSAMYVTSISRSQPRHPLIS